MFTTVDEIAAAEKINASYVGRILRLTREEFKNGKPYYALQGQRIIVPNNVGQRPDPSALSWHNEHRFRGIAGQKIKRER